MWRKPVGDGAKRVTTGVVMSERGSHLGRLEFSPVQGRAARVTRHCCERTLTPSLTCGDRRPYSMIGPMRVLRVWASNHWSVSARLPPVGVIARLDRAIQYPPVGGY